MKKIFSLSFIVIALAASMSAMNAPVPSAEKTINITTVSTNDSMWPEPGNPNAPYDK